MCLARLKGEREGIRVVREKKSEVLKNGIFRGIAKFTRHLVERKDLGPVKRWVIARKFLDSVPA